MLIIWRGEEHEGVRTAHGRTALTDSLDGCGSRAVLENNPQLGELLIKFEERGQESLLVSNAIGHDAWDLAVDVEDHVMLLHRLKCGVEVIKRGHPSLRVRRNACARC